MIKFRWFILYWLLFLVVVFIGIDILTRSTVQTVYVTDTIVDTVIDTIFRSLGEHHDGEFFPNTWR